MLGDDDLKRTASYLYISVCFAGWWVMFILITLGDEVYEWFFNGTYNWQGRFVINEGSIL